MLRGDPVAVPRRRGFPRRSRRETGSKPLEGAQAPREEDPVLETALSPTAGTRHRTAPVDQVGLTGRLRFRLSVVPASDARHELLADAQLRAVRELALLAAEVSR